MPSTCTYACNMADVPKSRKKSTTANAKLPSVQQEQRSKEAFPAQAARPHLCSPVQDTREISTMPTTLSASREVLHAFGSLREHLQAMESEGDQLAVRRGMAFGATKSPGNSTSPARSQRPGAPPPPPPAPPPSAPLQPSLSVHSTWSHTQPRFTPEVRDFQPRSQPTTWSFFPNDPRHYSQDVSGFSHPRDSHFSHDCGNFPPRCPMELQHYYSSGQGGPVPTG